MHVRSFLLFFLTLLCISCLKLNHYNENYSEAIKSFNGKRYNDAWTSINLALKENPRNKHYQILKIKIANSLYKFDDAIRILKNLEKKYDSDSIYFLTAMTYFSLGDYYMNKKDSLYKSKESFKSCINYCDRALNQNTNYYSAYLLKFKSLHNIEKYGEALLTINNSMLLFPDSAYLILGRGVEKLYLGDHTGALLDLNNSISRLSDSSDLTTAYRFRAIIKHDKGELDSAINDLSIGLKLNSRDVYSLINRGDYYREKGLINEACQDYRKAADLGNISVFKKINEFCSEKVFEN